MTARHPLLVTALVSCLLMVTAQTGRAADDVPQVGDTAADFELKNVGGEKVKLKDMAEKGPVVILVLRGFPGYQCPLCSKQVAQYFRQAEKFKAAGAHVLMVYPGPSKELTKRADEFMKGQSIPEPFELLVDPDYKFTNAYHLRWDAKNETAYPSTLLIGKDLKIMFAKVSRTHGDRTNPDEVLKVLTTK